MKILFVCRANVGRSQMASSLYNEITRTNNSDSVGTNINENEGQKISENGKAKFVIDVMDEEGIDVRNNKRKQLTQGMTEMYDKIIVMAKKEDLPDYLAKSDKVIFWDIEDPKDKTLDIHLKIKNQIKEKVMKLIEEINNN